MGGCVSTWTLLTRNPDRSIGGILKGYAFTLTLRLNEVGSWDLDIPRELCPAGWPAPGSGLVFLRDGRVVASGNWDVDAFKWSADPGSTDAGQGRFLLNGDTDLGRIAYRVVYPSPERAWDNQTVKTHYESTDLCEIVLRAVVFAQCMDGTPSARRVPGLTLASGNAAGTSVAFRERFTPLLEALRSTALVGGGLGFDVLDKLNGTQAFTVWAPTDRTETARFGRELGNLTDLEVRHVSPVANVALVSGSEEGLSRHALEQVGALGAWGRREMFVDQRQVRDADAPAGDPTPEELAEYEKAADEALASNGEQFSVSATTLDTPELQWGRDYALGDRVSVLTPFGPISDVVKQVVISVSDTGVEDIRSTVGASDLTTEDPLAETVRRLIAQVSKLQRER
jgi:hypothetical protein